MIGVSNRAPTEPMLVMLKVPPESSSGPILPLRVRSATSAILPARPARFRLPASAMTGNQQALVGVHRDRQVLGVVVGDFLLVLVVGRVDLRVLLQGLGDGLGDEGQEGQLDAVLGLEGVLGLGAQLGDLGHVDLVHLGQLGGDVQRLAHAAGDDLADPRGLLHGAAQRGGCGGAAGACRELPALRPELRRPARPWPRPRRARPACGCGRRRRCRSARRCRRPAGWPACGPGG